MYLSFSGFRILRHLSPDAILWRRREISPWTLVAEEGTNSDAPDFLLLPSLPPNRAKSVACYGTESGTVWFPPRCANAAAVPAAAAPARPRRIQRV